MRNDDADLAKELESDNMKQQKNARNSPRVPSKTTIRIYLNWETIHCADWSPTGANGMANTC